MPHVGRSRSRHFFRRCLRASLGAVPRAPKAARRRGEAGAAREEERGAAARGVRRATRARVFRRFDFPRLMMAAAAHDAAAEHAAPDEELLDAPVRGA
jgi:hypothetical protein